MFLSELKVENYRAVRSARVSFDDTTVLIGENDCGKSSLLEALACALDPEAGDTPPRFQPYHFHRTEPQPAARAIRIALHFRERRAGEWDALADSPLHPLLGPQAGGLRELVLDIRAAPVTGGGDSLAQWRLRAGAAEIRDPQALAHVRRMHPFIWLRGRDIVGGGSVEAAADQRSRRLPAAVRQLVERIESSHAALLAGSTADIQATLDEGYDAARQFLAYAARHLGGQQHNFQQMVAEILSQQRTALTASAPSMQQFAGSAAGRIGVLMLMGALLRAVPDALAHDAAPIWLIENPEAQLHPMTLAAVMGLIAHVSWQKIIATQSGEVLAAEPLSSLRRLTRTAGVLREWRVRPRSLSMEDLRRVGYHLRGRRGAASFARCWLLVEGETEFWVLPELARIAGYDLAVEGVACVEFAQCGLRPLIKLARALGIEWHVLTDGDRAGQQYVEQARRHVRNDPEERRITALRERDIEHCFYESGYASLFHQLAGDVSRSLPANQAIYRAIDRKSKPMLALELVLAASRRRKHPVPAPLAHMIATCVGLARAQPQRLAAAGPHQAA